MKIRFMPSIVFMLGIVLVAGLLAAACGGEATPAPTETRAPTPTAVPSVPTPTSAPTPTATRAPTPTAMPAVPTPTPAPAPTATLSAPGPTATPTVAAPTPRPTPTPTPLPRLATLEIRATDDPPPQGVTEILVTVKDIEVNITSGDVARGWTTVVSGDKTFDLIKITGIEELLGTTQLAPGQYNQVRLNVAKVEVTIEGEKVSATVPSGKLRFPGQFTAVAGETTVLTMDFDAGKSVVVAGAKKGDRKVNVKPVIKLLVRKGGEPPSAAKEAKSSEPAPTVEPIATPVPLPVATATPAPTSVPTPTPIPTPAPTATLQPTTTPIPSSKSLSPSKDNTLYESSTGSLSNGRGVHFFVGRTNNGSIRRSVIAFNIAGGVPARAKITSVRLTLNMSRTAQVELQTIELHRLLADWGEGASDASENEGGGASASMGDATWVHTFFDTRRWQTPGGDFSPTVSASTSAGGTGKYTWGSTAQMVADVQAWLDNPSSNFGWLLKGTEAGNQTTKRFDSRENSVVENRPVLVVEFTQTEGTGGQGPSSSPPGNPPSPPGSGGPTY